MDPKQKTLKSTTTRSPFKWAALTVGTVFGVAPDKKQEPPIMPTV